MSANDESKSVVEFGSRLSKSCVQIKGVLSTVSGLGASVGRLSHRCHAFKKVAGIIAQGCSCSVSMFNAWSCICLSNAYEWWYQQWFKESLKPTFSSSAFLRTSRLSSLEIWIRASHTGQSSASVDMGSQDGYNLCKSSVAYIPQGVRSFSFDTLRRCWLTLMDILRRLVVLSDNPWCLQRTCDANSEESGAGSPSEATCILGFINPQSSGKKFKWDGFSAHGKNSHTFQPRLGNPVPSAPWRDFCDLVKLTDQLWMFDLIQSLFNLYQCFLSADAYRVLYL